MTIISNIKLKTLITEFVQEGLRLRAPIKVVWVAALGAVNKSDVHKSLLSRSYKEEGPHVGVALRDIPQLELSIKTPISMTQNMHGAHPANKAQRDVKEKHMHNDNKSIPETYNKGSQSISTSYEDSS